LSATFKIQPTNEFLISVVDSLGDLSKGLFPFVKNVVVSDWSVDQSVAYRLRRRN
jgi:hypothetical protein